MHACTGIHHSFSFLRLYCGCARQTHSSACETNVPLSFSLSSQNVWQVSTRLRRRIALVFQSPPEICPQISARRDCANENFWLVFLFSNGPLFSRMFAWRCVAFVNRTRRFFPKTFGPLREIDTDYSGSASCDTQPDCRTLLHKSYCTSVTILLRPFARLTFNLPVRKWALCAEFTSRFGLIKLTFGCIPRVTKRFSASTFQEVFLHGCRLVFPDGLMPPRLLILDALLPLGVGVGEGGAVFGVAFARSWLSRRNCIGLLSNGVEIS